MALLNNKHHLKTDSHERLLQLYFSPETQGRIIADRKNSKIMYYQPYDECVQLSIKIITFLCCLQQRTHKKMNGCCFSFTQMLELLDLCLDSGRLFMSFPVYQLHG